MEDREWADTQSFDADFIDAAHFIETGDGVVHLTGAGWSSLSGWARGMQWLDRHVVDVAVPLTASVIVSGVALWATLSLVG
jgi:hypothetical protein